ncbi:MAG: hypothetical protein M3R47_17460 [Chloroflexota bacterium]|nr:hypothetical protein [Chloroflexota bacterium]
MKLIVSMWWVGKKGELIFMALAVRCECFPQESSRLAKNFKDYGISPDMVRMSLVSDITCIQTDEGWLYLAGLKGLSNRFLQSGEVGFGLSVQRCAHVADIFLYPFSTRYTFNH